MSTRTSKAALAIAILVLLFAFASPPGSAEKPESAVLEFSPKRGFYEKSFTLTLHSSDPALSIRYTKSGAEPTKASALLNSQPLTISNTVIVRAALFRGATRVSPVATHTYIFLDQVIRQPKDPPVGRVVLARGTGCLRITKWTRPWRSRRSIATGSRALCCPSRRFRLL